MKQKIWIILSIFLLFNQNFLTAFLETETPLPQIQTDNDTSGQSDDMLGAEHILNLSLSSILTGNSGGISPENSGFSSNFSISEDSFLSGDSILSGDSSLSGNVNSGYLDSGYSINSGIITPLPNLIISEVFFRGTDEWIEITNLSDSFSGNITLSGVKTSNLQISNVSISAGSTILLGDLFTYILDRSNILRSDLAFSISDSKSMDIKLIYSGIVIDSFSVDTGTVTSISDYRSLERIPNTNLITGTSIERKSNVTSTRIANPGSFAALQTISTGNSQLSGNQNTGFIDSGNLICMDSGATQILSISEIFPGNTDYGQYIELYASQAINQTIRLSGSSLISDINLDINLPAGGRILLTNDNLRFAGQNTQVLDNLNLSMSGGSLIIYGQSGQVLDSVYISSFSPNKSLYYSNFDGCVRRFFLSQNFSPGMDDKTFFLYMTTGQNTTQIVYVGGGGGSCSCPSCPNSPQSLSTGSVSSNMSNSIDNLNVKISDIIYDPEGSDTDNEIVILQSLSDQDIDLSPYRLQVEGQSTKKTIRGTTLPARSTTSYKGNYQFPNSPNCILLLLDSQILDKFCYSSSSNNQVPSEYPTNQIQNENKVSGYEIKITSIDYDPIGSDKENEKIGLKLISDAIQSIDLSDFKLQIQKDGKITNHSIQGILSANTEQFIRTNSIFPNSSNDGQEVQVSLIQDDILFASYTYNPNTISPEIQSGSFFPYSGLDFQITFVLPNPEGNDKGNEKIGVLVSSNSGYTYSGNINLSDKFYLQIGESRKKLSGYLRLGIENIITGNFTLPNKASCISLLHDKQILTTFCYEITKEGESIGQTNQVFDLLSPVELSIIGGLKFSQTNGQICVVYKDQKINCKKLPSTKTAWKDKQELKLYKNYMSTIQSYIKNQRTTFYFNSELENYFLSLSESKDQIGIGKLTKDINGESISIFEVEAYIASKKEAEESLIKNEIARFFGLE